MTTDLDVPEWARTSPLAAIYAAHQMLDTREPNLDGLAALRKPFPPEQVGKLPRITCGDCRGERTKCCQKHTKSECRDCGNWITGAHLHLDYVGHAAATQRLLEVDPLWSWWPMAFDSAGLPCVSVENGQASMWIVLSVCGVSRPGVGTCSAGKEERDKELIGDAIRNAGMRFGMALDLWSKEDLHANTDQGPEPKGRTAPKQDRTSGRAKPTDAPPASTDLVSSIDATALLMAMGEEAIVDKTERAHVKQDFRKKFGVAPAGLESDMLGEAWEWLTERLEVADHGYEGDGNGQCRWCGTMERAPWHEATSPDSGPDEARSASEGSGEGITPEGGSGGSEGHTAPELSAEWVKGAGKSDLIAALERLGLPTGGTIGELRQRVLMAAEDV